MADSGGGMHVMLVDDDPALARLVLHLLHAHGMGPGAHVTTGRDALDALEGVDVVLLDHQLPDADGLDLIEPIRARPNPPAVVLITAHGNESLAAAALRLGAEDYLAKDKSLPELLPQVLERVRRARELRKALTAAEHDLVQAERRAAIGELTVTLHHGINNPLMAASAAVELLLTEPGLPEPQRRQSLAEIQAALQRIRDIVRRIGDLPEVSTRPYRPGVRMVDLEGSDAARTRPRRGTALLFVPEENLGRIVGVLLRHAGFLVERCATLDALQRSVGQLGISLTVVQGGSAAAGAHPLGGFDPPPDRLYPVAALVKGDGAAARSAGADCVVELPFDPITFTDDMVALIR